MKTNPLLPIALIVSSDSATANFLRNTLRLSFQLIERTDAPSALEILQATSPDLVILDSEELEESPLLTLISQLRTALGERKKPILLITNNFKKKFAQDSLRAGATDFINKPLDEDEIEQRIAVAFQSFERTKSVLEVAKRSTPKPSSATSLSNREFLNDQAIKEISKARESGSSVTLLIIELDALKKDPLSSTTTLLPTLQSNLRKHDILIPQSPGKFILMLPKTSQRAAQLIAEVIRLDVEKVMFPLSVSIGLITWDPHHPTRDSSAEEFDQLIKVATQAVSEAKKTGNRIIAL